MKWMWEHGYIERDYRVAILRWHVQVFKKYYSKQVPFYMSSTLLSKRNKTWIISLKKKKITFRKIKFLSAVADLRGAQGTCAPRVQILSISYIFWEILAKSYVGAPRGDGAPSSGNPGSATDLRSPLRSWGNFSFWNRNSTQTNKYL